jgi:hypothetical protein
MKKETMDELLKAIREMVREEVRAAVKEEGRKPVRLVPMDFPPQKSSGGGNCQY